MTITKHGVMRFKQRQKIKNSDEMKRKIACAMERGKLVDNVSTSPETRCYLYDGYCYIVAANSDRLITVFRQRKPKLKSKKLLLDDIKIKEFIYECKFASISI